MKRLISLSLFLSSALCSHAQDVNKTFTLDEVTVQAAKVVNKADGLLIYPTNAQKQGSNNGFSILEKLSLANLRIDHVNHAVTAIDNRGEVQLRVNGVVVGKQEMLALDPKDVVKIDFVNNPGVRYGEGIAYVVDIVTRRSESGYTVGTDLTASLTTLQGDGMVYGKWNRGKSEWSLSYGMSGYRTRGGKSMQLARYTLADGSLYTIERNDVETLRKTMGQDAKLTSTGPTLPPPSFRLLWPDRSAMPQTTIASRISWMAHATIGLRVGMTTRVIRQYWTFISSARSPRASRLPPML